MGFLQQRPLLPDGGTGRKKYSLNFLSLFTKVFVVTLMLSLFVSVFFLLSFWDPTHYIVFWQFSLQVPTFIRKNHINNYKQKTLTVQLASPGNWITGLYFTLCCIYLFFYYFFLNIKDVFKTMYMNRDYLELIHKWY